MSSHDFDRRYRLLKVVAQADGVRTHNAQEVTTGRVVMIHLLDDAGPDVVEAMGRRLARLPDAEKTRVLETATLPAGFAVVTDFIPGLQSFPSWLTARVGNDAVPQPNGARAASEVAEPSEPAITAESPVGDGPERDADADPPQAIEFTVGGEGSRGEFTRLFMASGRLNLETTPAAEPPAPPVSPASAPLLPAASAAAPVAPPGSFTQMFGAAALPAPVATPVAAPVAASSAPASSAPAPVAPTPPAAPPGSFTQMFGAAAPSNSGADPRVADAAPAPLPLAAAPAPVAIPAPATPAPPAAPALAPGEFTRMFQAGTPAPLAGASASPLVALPTAPPSPPSAFPMAAPSGPAFSAAPVALPPSGPLPPLQGGATGALAALSSLAAPRGDVRGADALAAFGGAGSPSGGAPSPAQPTAAPFAAPAAPSGAPPLPPALAPMLTPPTFRAPGNSTFGGGIDSPFGTGASAAAAGGSEYTRMIRQSTTPPPPPVTPAPPKAALAPAAPKSTLPVPLIVAINVVLLLAVGLVLYFVLRPKPPAALPGAVPPAVTAPGAGPGSSPAPGATPSAAPAAPAPGAPAPAVPTAR